MVARRERIEDEIQKAIVAFHGAALVSPLDAILFAIPNGERRDAITAKRLVGNRPRDDLGPLSDALRITPLGLGVLPGAPDLALLTAGPTVTWIEVKRPKFDGLRAGRQQETQRAFQRVATSLGHDYRILRSVEAYQDLLIERGVPLRVRSTFPTPPPGAPEIRARFSPAPRRRR